MNTGYPTLGPTPRTNTLALASMIVGIVTWAVYLLFLCGSLVFTLGTLGVGGLLTAPLQILCCGVALVGCIASLVMGFLGRNQIRASNGMQKGNGYALTGIILGVIGIIVFMLQICAGIVAALIGIFGASTPSLPLPTPTK